MYSKKKIALMIFLTFIITSIMYIFVFTFVPAAKQIADYAKISLTGNTAGAKINEIHNLIDNCFIDDYDQDSLDDYAAKGYVAALNDPYSEYLDKESYKKMVNDLSGDYKGIGVEVFLSESGNITVNNVFEDSPAYKAGIHAGDIIISVNNIAVGSENYNEAINMMTGAGKYKEKDKLELILQRNGQNFTVKVTRKALVAKTVFSKMLNDKTGYIRISQFDDKSPEEFEKKINEVLNDGAKSLVIDLRNNPGGTLPSVVTIADRILPKCKIFTVKEKNSKPTEYMSDDKQQLDIPMCVLINQYTASAAEVLASSLHDNGLATIVGEKSYGKGVVQSIFNLSDGCALKITTAKYLTASGNDINKKGIIPDVEVHFEGNFAQVNNEESKDIQLQKAIEILKEK